ncbi:hypothetical protein M0R45_017081 [Rubus argutus]|uniref:Uncharacterized protein n=1 Tax=Rubus argutus TaxID=59490 RepID=A0AAW1XUX2_RUBAR
MMNMANLNASAKNDDPNFLYVKRRMADGKHHHNLAKLDPRAFDGGETLHAAALGLCKSALAENHIGDAVVVSLKKRLGGLEITWFYNDELTTSMLRTICNSAYEPECGREEEEKDDEKEEAGGNNGGAWDL